MLHVAWRRWTCSAPARLIAGLVQGWMAEEFAVAGVPQEDRGARMREYMQVVRAVWGGSRPHSRGASIKYLPRISGPSLYRRNPNVNDFEVLKRDIASFQGEARGAGARELNNEPARGSCPRAGDQLDV